MVYVFVALSKMLEVFLDSYYFGGEHKSIKAALCVLYVYVYSCVCVCNVAFEKQNKKQFQCNDSIGIENLCPENFQQQKNKRQAFT